jgi:hypothetical protein
MVTLFGGTSTHVRPVPAPTHTRITGFRRFETSERLMRRTPDDSVDGVGHCSGNARHPIKMAPSQLAALVKELVECLAPCDHSKLPASQFFYDLEPLFKIFDLSG